MRGARDRRGFENRQDNRQRGFESQPQPRGTVPGATQPQRPPGNGQQPANPGNERGNERRER
jgi:hypothetical protein